MESVVAWVLVAVMLDGGRISISVNTNIFPTMSSCFEYRDKSIALLPEWPTPNIQFVCVPADSKGMGGYAL